MVQRAPGVVRAAGLLVGLEGLVGVGYLVALVGYALTDAPQPGFVFAQAGFVVLVAGAVVAVGVGLVTGRRWARTPAIVLQLLLLPVVYTLLGPNQQLLFGVLTGVVVITAFLLLISERARRWVVGVDAPDAQE